MKPESLIRAVTIAPMLVGAIFGFRPPAFALTPNDPLLGSQWYLQKIGAFSAWDRTTGDASAVVAVIDTGVDTRHPDLAENIWKNPGERLDGLDNDGNGYADDLMGWNFVEEVGDPRPRFDDFTPGAVNHGTEIAGEVAARGGNGQGIAGLSWRARIMAIRALDSRGQGDTGTIVRAIDYAVRNGAHILGLSFVGPDVSPQLNEAIRRAADAGVLVVAAAGNAISPAGQGRDLDASPLYPVCSDGGDGVNRVIGVAAVDRSDRRFAFSAYGRNCVDISAPGEDMYSTQVIEPSAGLTSGYGGGLSGSSLAVPLVAGSAALIRSLAPNLTADQIRDLLLTTADPIDGLNPGFEGKLGRGRLNVGRAIASIVTAAPPTAAPTERVLASATGPGVPSEVRIFTRGGAFVRSFAPYAPQFLGGISIAEGDVDGGGAAEIVTVPGRGGGPHVRIWKRDGTLVGQFFAFDSSDSSGLSVAVGDFTGDGIAEIAVARRSGSPLVRLYNRSGTRIAEWYAYDPRFLGGVRLASADTDGDEVSEIVTAPGPGGGPHVRLFTPLGAVISEYFAGLRTDTRGLDVAAGDLDGDGKDEVAVRSIGDMALRGYNRNGALTHEIEIDQKPAPAPFSLGDLDGNGTDEIILGTPLGADPALRALTRDGALTGFVQPYVTIRSTVSAIVIP